MLSTLNMFFFFYIRIYTLPVLTFCFDYGVHLLWHCFDNLMQCHNNYFHPQLHLFGQDVDVDDRRVEPFLQSIPLTPNTFNRVKVRTENDSSCSTLWELEPDESWHCCPGICPSHQGRKKSIDRITWSFSTFRNSAGLHSLDLANWSNPTS